MNLSDVIQNIYLDEYLLFGIIFDLSLYIISGKDYNYN